VLRRITLDVAPSEFVTIMGPSGAGKSTLLSILGMLDADFTGEYFLRGHPVHALRHEQRRAMAREHIGFVFQQYHLLDELTVAENLHVPLDYRGVGKSERAARVADILDRFNMVGKKDLYPRQLSGGQQQLVGIARAVIAKPSLLLADEPTGNLDSQNGEAVMSLLQELHRGGATICMVTHDPRYAEYADRSVHLFDGRVVEDTTHDEKRRAAKAGTTTQA
jgi:ABC-type lipoprotein export system ATPase subunit